MTKRAGMYIKMWCAFELYARLISRMYGRICEYVRSQYGARVQ
jgi:hypothetical protein